MERELSELRDAYHMAYTDESLDAGSVLTIAATYIEALEADRSETRQTARRMSQGINDLRHTIYMLEAKIDE